MTFYLRKSFLLHNNNNNRTKI